eukprot:226052-Pleurochrysis_carterae.AAC.3
MRACACACEHVRAHVCACVDRCVSGAHRLYPVCERSICASRIEKVRVCVDTDAWTELTNPCRLSAERSEPSARFSTTRRQISSGFVSAHASQSRTGKHHSSVSARRSSTGVASVS